MDSSNRVQPYTCHFRRWGFSLRTDFTCSQFFFPLRSDIATIYVDEGVVLVVRQQEGSVERIPVATSFRLEPGDEIIMESGSARIEFFKGQSTTLSENAHIGLESLTQVEGATEVVLVVYDGETHHKITTPLDEDDRFVVRAISTTTSDEDVVTTVTSKSDLTLFGVSVDSSRENETIVPTHRHRKCGRHTGGRRRRSWGYDSSRCIDK